MSSEFGDYRPSLQEREGGLQMLRSDMEQRLEDLRQSMEMSMQKIELCALGADAELQRTSERLAALEERLRPPESDGVAADAEKMAELAVAPTPFHHPISCGDVTNAQKAAAGGVEKFVSALTRLSAVAVDLEGRVQCLERLIAEVARRQRTDEDATHDLQGQVPHIQEGLADAAQCWTQHELASSPTGAADRASWSGCAPAGAFLGGYTASCPGTSVGGSWRGDRSGGSGCGGSGVGDSGDGDGQRPHSVWARNAATALVPPSQLGKPLVPV